jgi:uncharacterized protein with HEPN domain
MHNNDYFLLLSLRNTIDKIFRYCSNYESAEELYQNDRDFDATIMNFIALGELVNKLSEELKKENTHIDWSKIYSFRNILAHHYFGINVDIVWQIICGDLPILKKDIIRILGE